MKSAFPSPRLVSVLPGKKDFPNNAKEKNKKLLASLRTKSINEVQHGQKIITYVHFKSFLENILECLLDCLVPLLVSFRSYPIPLCSFQIIQDKCKIATL